MRRRRPRTEVRAEGVLVIRTRFVPLSHQSLVFSVLCSSSLVCTSLRDLVAQVGVNPKAHMYSHLAASKVGEQGSAASHRHSSGLGGNCRSCETDSAERHGYVGDEEKKLDGRPRRNEEVVGSRRDVGGQARGELGQCVVGVGGTPEEQGRGTPGHPRDGQGVER